MPRIRPAKPDEADSISSLALRSKAHWGYAAEELAVFRDELTIAPDEVVAHRTHVVEEEGRILGFYTLVRRSDAETELEHVFVEPGVLERGLGRALFEHACDRARLDGSLALVIQSDPNAAGFYHRLGAQLVDEIPSSIPGRTIPYFRFDLGDGTRD